MALVIIASVLVVGYVAANLRWQAWDRRRRLDRQITRRVRERIEQHYRVS